MHDIQRFDTVTKFLPTSRFGCLAEKPAFSEAPMEGSALPVAQLESLRFKANQIIESIQALQWQLEGGGRNVMPPWPDILAKYNLLLSQTHNLSTTLVGGISAQSSNRRTDPGGSSTLRMSGATLLGPFDEKAAITGAGFVPTFVSGRVM